MAAAAEPQAVRAEAQEAAAAPPAALPLSDVVTQVEAAEQKRHDLESALAADAVRAAVEEGLPGLTGEIETERRNAGELLALFPSLEKLSALEAQWTKRRELLAGWKEKLGERAKQLDASLADLDGQKALWSTTRKQAETASAPREMIQRIGKLLEDLGQTRTKLEGHRGAVLKLQSLVAEQDGRVGEVQGKVRAARDESVRGLFVAEAPPIWKAEVWARRAKPLAERGHESMLAQKEETLGYLKANTGRLLLHAAVVAGLFWLLRHVRRVDAGTPEGKLAGHPSLSRFAAAAEHPLQGAWVFSLPACFWIYPEPPRLLVAAAVLISLPPGLAVLRRLVPPLLHPVFAVLLGFFLYDGARNLAVALPVVARPMFLAEMLAGSVAAFWLARRMTPAAGNGAKIVRAWARTALLAFAGAFLLNAGGWERLSELVGNAVLKSSYLAVAFAGLATAVDALLLGISSVPPLRNLGMVRRFRPLLWERSRSILRWGLGLLWARLTLRLLSLDHVAYEKAAAILNARPAEPSPVPSLGNVLSFGLVVWASFLLSRLIRFVLEEECYPRIRLARGLPYAISTMLHYAVLLIGFFFAVHALGFDLTKVTILAGAFGVGLGFGLQNIVNNFVSGLILLFERPVNVGDVVQIGEASGVVNQIGVRASVIRTSSGSEIIVPNGTLIADRVTNWTRSNRQRGMEIAIHVAANCDPACVIDLLRRAAAEHPRVAAHPAPNAYFLKMSPTVYEFEVRAWTPFYEEWFQIRSDLAVALHAALRKEGIPLAAAPAVPAAVK